VQLTVANTSLNDLPWNTPEWPITCTGGCPPAQLCVARDTCACPTGYSGSNCTTPVCQAACNNGGVCSAPNTCTCTMAFTGPTCDRDATAAAWNSATFAKGARLARCAGCLLGWYSHHLWSLRNVHDDALPLLY
jgi:hypothetical protein